MTNGSGWLTAEDIVLGQQTDADLPKIRAKVKRFKPPEVSADGHWENAKVGVFTTAKKPRRYLGVLEPHRWHEEGRAMGRTLYRILSGG